MIVQMKEALKVALESLDAVDIPQEWDCRQLIRDALELVDHVDLASSDLILKAREIYGSDSVGIDDDAAALRVVKAMWVQAWVRLSTEKC